MQHNITLQIHYNHAHSLHILQTAGKTLVKVAAHSEINFPRKSNVIGNSYITLCRLLQHSVDNTWQSHNLDNNFVIFNWLNGVIFT